MAKRKGRSPRSAPASREPEQGAPPAAPRGASAESASPRGAAPKAAVPPEAATEGPAPLRPVLATLGAFILLALGILAITRDGYRINRATSLAERAIAAGRHVDAVPHLDFITARYPKAWVRLTQLGDCLLETDRPQEALAAYQRSLAANPEQDLSAQLGQVDYLLGLDDEAIGHLRRAIETDPNNARANYYIGLYYMRVKNYAKAAFFLQAASGDAALFEKSKPHLAEIKARLLDG